MPDDDAVADTVDVIAVAEDLREFAAVGGAEIGVVEGAGDDLFFLLGAEVGGEQGGNIDPSSLEARPGQDIERPTLDIEGGEIQAELAPVPALLFHRQLMRFLRRRWHIILISGIALLGIAAFGLIYWAGSEIASPPRRALVDYHREYLTNPTAHGITIQTFTASDGTPCLVVVPAPSGNLGKRGSIIRQQLTARGIQLKPTGSIIATLVLCHGRKGRKEDYLPIAERLCAVGFRCVIPDLPGHGDHPQAIATYGIREATLPARVLTEAAAKFSFIPQPAGLLGMSMGGSVAMHAADLPAPLWKALVIISSFDSFPATIEGQASRHIGSVLGPLWADGAAAIYQTKAGIPLSDIQPRRHVAKIRIPTLIAHGTADTVISIASGRRLFDALPETTLKQWVEIPGAGHDNVLVTSYPIYADIAEWMLQHVY